MGFNYGFEKKKFDLEWERLRKEYKAAGMSDLAIQKIYEFDLASFNRKRADANHEQPLSGFTWNESEEQDESKSVLYKKFLKELSYVEEYHFSTDRFGWIEEVSNITLYTKIKKLTSDEKEILTLLVFEGYTQRDIAKIRGVSEQAIIKRIKFIKKLLKQV